MAMAILYLMYQDKIIYKDVLEESLFFGEL
jgi:hypothetical protein